MFRFAQSELFKKSFMLVAFSAVIMTSACSSTDDGDISQEPVKIYERDNISGDGALSDIYSDNLDGPAPGTQADLVVNVGDRVFFGYDRYDLSPDARATLDNQARWLQQYPNLTITIEGHADERGTREYNLALAERRANAAKNYLIALGVDPRKVSTISYGKERPAVPGSNENAWAQNRRGVTKVN